MPYSPTTWQDRVVQYPARYSKTGETASEVTLTASPGTVTQAGTPLNATNMNKIESGISAALPRDGSAAMTGQILAISGSVNAPAISRTGDSNTGMYFPASDEIAFSQGGFPSVRITADLNVGIGTIAPASRLHISSATGSYLPSLRITNTSAAAGFQSVLAFYTDNSTSNQFLIGKNNIVDGGSTFLSNQANTPMIFETNAQERMRITAAGAFNFSVAGTQTTPTITSNTDTNTGIYWAAADKLAFTEGGKGITLDELKMMGSMGGML
jgi:hypothetical protein